MGIDGVGKPGSGIPLGSGVPEAPSAGVERGERFRAELNQAQPSEVSGAEPLGQLERGQIQLDQYLDLRVQEATAHLEGKLAPEQLDFIKQSLREQLATDPVLAELVQRATGKSPPVSES